MSETQKETLFADSMEIAAMKESGEIGEQYLLAVDSSLFANPGVSENQREIDEWLSGSGLPKDVRQELDTDSSR